MANGYFAIDCGTLFVWYGYEYTNALAELA